MAAGPEQILTAAGYQRLREELDYLRTVRRSEIAERLRAAREEGEADSSDYMLAREEQGFVEGRIATLEKLMSEAEVVEAPASTGRPGVGIGSTVIVRNDDGEEERYEVVGPMEADPAQERISSHSPVGQALLGRHKGETVEVETPMGIRRLKVVKVQ